MPPSHPPFAVLDFVAETVAGFPEASNRVINIEAKYHIITWKVRDEDWCII